MRFLACQLALVSLLTSVIAVPGQSTSTSVTTKPKTTTTTSVSPTVKPTQSLQDWCKQGFYDIVVGPNDTLSDIAFHNYNYKTVENANGVIMSYDGWHTLLGQLRSVFKDRKLIDDTSTVAYWDDSHSRGSVARQSNFTGLVNGTMQLVTIDTILSVENINGSYSIIAETFIYVYGPYKK